MRNMEFFSCACHGFFMYIRQVLIPGDSGINLAFGMVASYGQNFLLKNPTLNTVAPFQYVKCCERKLRTLTAYVCGGK